MQKSSLLRWQKKKELTFGHIQYRPLVLCMHMQQFGRKEDSYHPKESQLNMQKRYWSYTKWYTCLLKLPLCTVNDIKQFGGGSVNVFCIHRRGASAKVASGMEDEPQGSWGKEAKHSSQWLLEAYLVIYWQEPNTGWKAWQGQLQSARPAGLFLQASLRDRAFRCPERALGPDTVEQAGAGKELVRW